MRNQTTLKSALVLAIGSLLLAQAAFGQFIGAVVSGSVTDPSSAVIPNARVTVRNLRPV